MTTAADLVDVTRYAQEYERLRSEISGASRERSFGSAPVRGIGLALLLREGLPAWIRAVRQVLCEAAASAAGNAGAAPRAPPAIPPLAAGADGSGLPISSSALVETGRQHDLTALLASLVLSARRTTDAASMKEPSPCH